MARESSESATLLPATQYHNGPLTDIPPAHIATVLTSMTYTEEFLNNLGMKQICLIQTCHADHVV